MKNLLLLLLLLISLTLDAQTITGKVAAEKDKSLVQFASVGLLQLPDSVIISGVITLTDGTYTFEKVKPGQYCIKVSFVGYGTGISHVDVTEGRDEFLVDTIFLAEAATNLEEVTVTAERLKGRELVDRTVYSIPAQVSKSTNNGYDLLKKIPQVNVDFQNNVSLNGSTNFIVQVDGRVRDKEFLAKLLPTDIETIEIISNPSGKYEGNVDGVISIILKKEARYGMNGNFSLYTKPFKKMTNQASASVDYALGRITFYATGLVFSQNLSISNQIRNDFTLIDSLSSTAGNGDLKVTSSSVNAGFDYYLNDRNDLSLNFSYKPVHQDVAMSSEAELFKSNTIENTLTSLSDNKLKSSEYNISLFYRKGFNNALQELTSETNYYYFTSDSRDNFSNTRYNYDPRMMLGTYGRSEMNYNRRSYLSSKLNYVHPVGLSAKLEAGYQFYYQNMNYDFIIDNDEAVDNLFIYEEYRNSLYGGFTFNLKKFGFQSMLRMENSNIDADSVTAPDYTCLLPSVNLQYKLSSAHNLKFTYNRRINRPGIYDMNPYYKVGANYEITQGNPNLKPEYRDRMQLTYTWNFGSNYFSPHVYYEVLSDKIGQRYINIKSPIDSSRTTFGKPFNLLSGHEFGGGINAMLWFVNVNAQIFKGHYNEYSGQSTFIAEKDYYSFSITSYAFAPLTKDKKTTAYVFLSYNGVSVDAQTKTYSMPFYGLGAQKQIKDHSIGIFYLLPFSKNVDFRKTVTEMPTFSAQNIIGFDVSCYIQFMYSYKFNKGKNVKKLNRQVNIESDSKTEGISQ